MAVRLGRRPTLAGQLLVLQLAIVVIVLVAVAAVSLAQSAATFNRVEGRRVTLLAEQLSSSPALRFGIRNPAPAEMLAPALQTSLAQSGVTSITVANSEGKVIAATNPTLIGSDLTYGDQAGDKRRGWSGQLRGDGGMELVAQVPVLSEGRNADGNPDGSLGDHIGTVMVGERAPSVLQRLRGASSYLAIYLGIACVLGLLGSWLLARRIKRQTLGLEPREIAGLAEHREAMLYGLAEGVVALDPHLRVTLVNDVGRRLLDLPSDAVGKSLRELGVEGRLREVLAGEDEARDAVVVRRGRVLVMNRMSVTKDGRSLGSVTTLRDRTELAQLERELGSFRSSAELLRAQTHEFANQLHTISGLIQIGEYDEVVTYVGALNRYRESLDLTVTRRVHDTTVAALLMAKSSLAAERRVELRVSERTTLLRLDPELSADIATVLGNLVDNAVDAAAQSGTPLSPAWVEVELRQDATSVEIVVRDSGPGVAPELAQEVFAHGFTTKAAAEGERGIGLAMTRLICRRRGGEVAVTNLTEGGAAFVARMSTQRTPEGAR
ncbi:sensor histidine kinase regulating citrate/malate metabolism [Kribbella sp. VKM Ac-2569]|uniref:sensor histidine kinase n=1 Tax=Kribbella sp. VKM Ac-2569 TaxID=2512220 RepID=UPI00102BD53E|nr:ATP-binding protein [Kribbella sp. VKM Ac-2569]RZT28611.1 sensor histidine kinase regulating citrate/malate metabolism [Kribbella sp. VKM Ac-2569]